MAKKGTKFVNIVARVLTIGFVQTLAFATRKYKNTRVSRYTRHIPLSEH
jgi:hypothetical protein